ncbi:transcription antitermination factor NusB [Lacibacterium aquatile]|uniref:Transcription antitermination protein NusB n=1 Tax=Lacibacterium aquatile TaxID=1168082 RepID=A0ABW5DR83_9PROT
MSKDTKKPRTNHGRSAARLAAVQAIYSLDINPDSATIRVIADFSSNYLMEGTDKILFGKLVDGAQERRADVDEMIIPNLASGWTIDKIDSVLRAILRVSVYELLAMTEVPSRVVINEYVEIAHAFFTGGEPGMVNGMLDKLARRLRATEFGESA